MGDVYQPAPVEIADEDDLLRRIALNHVRRDGTISSTAFMLSSKSKKDRRPDPDVSVDLARLTTPRRSLRVANRPTQGIASIQAGFPRSLGLEVVHSPTAENVAHSSIRGNEGEAALDKCDLLADEMTKTILIYPQGAAIRVGWNSPPDSVLGD